MSEPRTTFDTGAVRSAIVAGDTEGRHPARFDLVSTVGLRRLAETYGEGAAKYGDNNWRRGMPASVLVNHALAHLVQILDGDTSEDHAAHAAWNLFALMEFQEKRPELIDLPARPAAVTGEVTP